MAMGRQSGTASQFTAARPSYGGRWLGVGEGKGGDSRSSLCTCAVPAKQSKWRLVTVMSQFAVAHSVGHGTTAALSAAVVVPVSCLAAVLPPLDDG